MLTELTASAEALFLLLVVTLAALSIIAGIIGLLVAGAISLTEIIERYRERGSQRGGK